MKSVGEVEFVNGVAAMGASGIFGDIQVCAGIVGDADCVWVMLSKRFLRLISAAGGSRYRGCAMLTLLMILTPRVSFVHFPETRPEF